MSSLLNKLQTDGSQLTGLDGKSSPLYDRQSQYLEGLATSQLDLDGKKPLAYDGQSQYVKGLEESQLDLNGRTPAKYQFLASVRSLDFIRRGFATSQLDLDGKTPAKYLDNPPR